MNGVIVCVTMRPGQRDNLRNNYFQQKHRLPLIVVVNGPAATEAEKYLFDEHVTVVPGVFRNKAACFQVGLVEASDLMFDYWLCWDDDDYYGPAYCQRYHHAFEEGAQLVGQHDRFMKTSEGRLWSLTGCHTNNFLMCTIGARLDKTAPWTDIEDRMGQEVVWLDRMRQVPRKVMHMGDFAHCRYNDGDAHVWGVSDQHIALKSQGVVHDLGPWNPGIVDLMIPAPQRVPVALDEEHWAPVTPDGGIAKPMTLRKDRHNFDHAPLISQAGTCTPGLSMKRIKNHPPKPFTDNSGRQAIGADRNPVLMSTLSILLEQTSNQKAFGELTGLKLVHASTDMRERFKQLDPAAEYLLIEAADYKAVMAGLAEWPFDVAFSDALSPILKDLEAAEDFDPAAPIAGEDAAG